MGQEITEHTRSAMMNVPESREEKDNQWLANNYAPVGETWDQTPVYTLEGRIPEGLVGGQYIRNGPNPQWKQDGRPYHWFDGDGMLHGVYFGSDGPTYLNRYIQTAKLSLEREMGGNILPTIGSFMSLKLTSVFRGIAAMQLGRFLSKESTTSNTALTYHNRRLLALIEAGPPKQVMAPDLTTIGDYKFADDNLGKTNPNSFAGDIASSSVDGREIVTAHPKVCPKTGNMYFFGYDFQAAPYVCYSACDVKGNLFVNTRAIPECDRPVMMHDMAITDQWAIVFDLPMIFDPQTNLKAGKSAISYDASKPARFHLLPRETGGPVAHTFQCDALMIFHSANAYESADGEEVVLLACASKDPNLARTSNLAESHPYLTEFRFHLSSGKMTQKRLVDIPGEFPMINPKYMACRESRYTYLAREALSGNGTAFDGLIKYDSVTGDTKEFLYPEGFLGGEASFAPSCEVITPETQEDDGFLISFVSKNLADRDNYGQLYIINTKTMELECVLEMPARVPYGFHGFWMNKSAIDEQIRDIPVQRFKAVGWSSWALSKVMGYLSA